MKDFKSLNLMGLVALALTTSTLAFAGGESGGGGDPVLLRMKLIKEYINTELRADATVYMRNFDADRIANGPARAALQDMLARDVVTDIEGSSYVIRKSCMDVGSQKAGGAITNDLGGDICLSVRRLAELDSSKAEIVGLIIHEHAHHFGYTDADYAIYKAVYQSMKLDSPAWSDADPSNAQAPAETRVSHGANHVVYKFTKVTRKNLGEGWRDPSGLIWFDRASDIMNWDEALDHCSELGGRLPTKAEFEQLGLYMGATRSASGEYEYRGFSPPHGFSFQVLPNILDRFGFSYIFWSSSVRPYNADFGDCAYVLMGYDGQVGFFPRDNSRDVSVRCVAR